MGSSFDWYKWVKKTPHPSEIDKQKVLNHWIESSGWVYVAKVGNRNDFWKVGMTGRDNPFKRTMEMSNAVMSTESFDIVWADFFINRHTAEKSVHLSLTQRGRWVDKEFFMADIEEIKNILSVTKEEETLAWAGWNIKDFELQKEKIDHSNFFSWEEWWEKNNE